MLRRGNSFIAVFVINGQLRAESTTSAAPIKKQSSYFKMANVYKPGRFTSKDLPKGPTASNQPWDPVFAHYLFHRITGPLRRKQNTTPDDHLTVDEAEKWMDARSAAKVLGIKEEELPHLTSAQVEQKWAKVYGERSNAQQQETVIAAEVLLEYIDSSLQRKKSRQYYRQYVDNARHSIDHETELRRQEHRQKFIYLFGVAMFIGCTAVMGVAFFHKAITREDIESIGKSAISYVNITLAQPKNFEPPPNYTTRYRDTPSAMELDKRDGTFGLAVANLSQQNVLSEMEGYRHQEEAEMVRILNDENERVAQEENALRARESRVRVYRQDDFDESGQLKKTSQSDAETDPAAAFSQMSFRQFAGMMASQFGGGSRFQRITQDSVKRTEEIEEMRKRMKE